MKKTGLLMLTLGALSFIVGSTNYDKTPTKELDSRYIVSLNVPTGNKDAVLKSQKEFVKQLQGSIGFAYKVVDRFSLIDNALVLNINEKDKKIVESLPLVSEMTKDEFYFFSETNFKQNDGVSYINETLALEEEDEAPDKTDPTINYSAQTMNVPEKNKGGEGTVVAVLDSGFLLNHNAFAPIEGEVSLRYPTEESVESVIEKNKDHFHGKFTKGVKAPEQGHLEFITGEEDVNTFYNNKIPYQYDYGGSLYTYNNPDTNETEYYEKKEDGTYRKLSFKEYASDVHFPDSNAYSAYNEHGTHVAGIIGANDRKSFQDPEKFIKTGTYEGIAPKSQLVLMKVFTDYIPRYGVENEGDNPQIPYTGASDSSIMQALEDCLILDVDAINMSLGQDLNDFDTKSASFKAFKKLRENGTLVNVSAGNNGRQLYGLMGPYANHLTASVENGTLGSYANSDDVMTIGSGNLTYQYFKNAILINGEAVAYDDQVVKEKNEEFTGANAYPLSKLGTTGEIPFYFVPGYGKLDDYPENIEEQLYAKTIAVVKRGGDVPFTEKIIAAKTKGFQAIIIINNDPGATDFNMRMDLTSMAGNIGIPVVMVLNKDLPVFLKAVEQHGDKEGFPTLKIIEKEAVANPKVGQLSEFSTDGATYDLRIKPEIVAPGSVIKGPIPGKVNYGNQFRFEQDKAAYDYLSGTSMSGPNYTGAVAVALSEKSIDRETRKDYVDTIPMRFMSTAAVKSSITGDITEANKEEALKAAYAVRRQGAGTIDVAKALNTKIYLEGNVAGRSKIELYNNNDIAKGDIKLPFTIHNESDKAVTYKPTLYVYKPDTLVYKETPTKDKDGNEMWDNKEFSDANVTMQTINEKLIKKVDFQEVMVEANTSKLINTVHTSLTSEEKAEIDKTFENGTYLEGYVFLEPVTSTKETNTAGVESLNIPFMGFYGDYFAEFPVEKFDFERKEGEVLGSDLIQTLNNKMGLKTADFGSMIRGIKLTDMNDMKFGDNLQATWTNRQSLRDFTEELHYDPDTNCIYAGSPEKTDLLFFQLFVNRSVKKSKIQLIDEKGNDYAFDVFGDNRPRFYDPLLGADDDGLAKSMGSAGWLGNLQAHRAHGFLPLIDSRTGKILPDGKYTIKMSFTYQAGTNRKLSNTEVTKTKEVGLIIDGTAPELTKKEIVNIEGTEYLRVYITEKHLKNVAFNGGFIGDGKFTPVEGTSDQYYAQVSIDEIKNLDKGNKIFIKIEDVAYSETLIMFNLTRNFKGNIALSSSTVNPGSTLVAEKSDKITNVLSRTYKIALTNEKGEDVKISSQNKYTVYVNVDEFDFDDPKELKVYRLDKTGYRLPIKQFTYIEESNEIKFEIRDPEFVIEGKLDKDAYNSNDGGDLIPSPDGNNGNRLTPGAIVGISIGGVAGGAGIGVGIYFLVKFILKKRVL